MATGKELHSISGHTSLVISVAFSPNGKFALSGSCGEHDVEDSYSCIKGSLKLWELATGKELRSFSGHTGAVKSEAF